MRHVIANVRMKTGLSQSQLSKILGCSIVTVQRIEQGTLALSEDLAAKAQKVLDVSADWLLVNDPTQPATTPRGGLWTEHFYELTQGTPPGHSWKITRGVPLAEAQNSVNAFTALKSAEIHAQIDAMLEGAKGRSKQGVLLHRVNKALAAWKEDFPLDESTLKKHRPKIEKARKVYDEISKKISDRELDELWSDNWDESKN
jgi:transcriptional regulator with XRE-family HTH domain